MAISNAAMMLGFSLLYVVYWFPCYVLLQSSYTPFFTTLPSLQSFKAFSTGDTSRVARRDALRVRAYARPRGRSCALGVDDIDELGLERRAADEEAVNVGTLRELLAVGGVHGTTVDDAGRVGDGGGHDLLEVGTDIDVRLLGLRGGGDLAGTDGPDGLVRDYDLPVMRRKTAIRDL